MTGHIPENLDDLDVWVQTVCEMQQDIGAPIRAEAIFKLIMFAETAVWDRRDVARAMASRLCTDGSDDEQRETADLVIMLNRNSLEPTNSTPFAIAKKDQLVLVRLVALGVPKASEMGRVIAEEQISICFLKSLRPEAAFENLLGANAVTLAGCYFALAFG